MFNNFFSSSVFGSKYAFMAYGAAAATVTICGINYYVSHKQHDKLSKDLVKAVTAATEDFKKKSEEGKIENTCCAELKNLVFLLGKTNWKRATSCFFAVEELMRVIFVLDTTHKAGITPEKFAELKSSLLVAADVLIKNEFGKKAK
jgi:hypothetical protein